MQAGLRKTVFEHAVRLPLHRIFQLKSGGAASILREDAGNVADLIFSMIYNPWRAIIQFTGSLIVLLCVDWRLMLAGVVLLPIVYVTHRTWISRIRPQHRRVRAQREQVDALAAESFGGVRVVRAFARQEFAIRSVDVGGLVLAVVIAAARWPHCPPGKLTRTLRMSCFPASDSPRRRTTTSTPSRPTWASRSPCTSS